MNTKTRDSGLLAGVDAHIASREGALAELSRRAAERFGALGLPGGGREDWKYNRLDGGVESDFTPLPAAGGKTPDPARFRELHPNHLDAHRFVFIDGRHRSELSEVGDLPAGASARNLVDATSEQIERAGIGKLAGFDDAAFTALNTAWLSDGFLLILEDGVELTRPVELLFLATQPGRMTSPRVSVQAGSGSRATLIENYASMCAEGHLTNGVGEIRCGEEAEFRHVKLLRENAAAWHLGSTHVEQAAGSRYRSREFLLGGAMNRRELHLELTGPGAECDLNALYMGQAEQVLDMRTRVRHSAPDCETRELYKGILDGNSRGIFDGLIHVAEDAQRTDARQSNRNLLLSRDATANSMPRLEIYADDVKCSHGSTVGQIDAEQLFYLRSRGFDPESARALLTHAFAKEIVESVDHVVLRQELMAELGRRLPGSETMGGPA
ncbi:MAG: Fe-S cluster assembly protein SufD [bacterium]|nr:Fe-S cluster assembly protein SufD [bacterium]